MPSALAVPCTYTTSTFPMDYPKPTPGGGGVIGKSLKGCLLQNSTKKALEGSEENFVTNFYHFPHLAWCLCYIYMLNGLIQAQSHWAL